MAYGYYPQYFQQPQQQAQMPQPQQMPIQQMQNGGFVSVRSEDEARNYPVGLGYSVTFKDETAPYIYTKTMGFSQLDRPTFDKYKLVKESPSVPSDLPDRAGLNSETISTTFADIKGQIEAIWSEIDGLKSSAWKPTTVKRKKEVTDDDADADAES